MTVDRLLRTLDQPRRLIWAAFAAIVAAGWGTLAGADPLAHDPLAHDLWRSLCGPAHAATGFHMAMWVAMVFAMMLPSAAPMISTYMDIAEAARRKAIPVAQPAVLAAGYLVVWLSFAIAAGYLQARFDVPQIPGGTGVLLLVAGLWQFAPVKHACLTRCRAPMPYFLAHWSEQPGDVFRMGMRQGLFCLGCCGALMMLMFAAGAMNLLWMAVLGLVMILEKTMARPQLLVQMVGAVLVLLGLAQLGWKFFA
jgi:predicted metal-binding membrane protein